MSVSDPGGQIVASTLTAPDGAFRVALPSAGQYRVEGEHIGFHSAAFDVDLARGERVWIELRAETRAIELEGLVAEVDRGCRVPEDVAVRLVGLWEEVAKAFRVAELVEDRGLYRFEVERWTRRLDADRLRVEEEERARRSGFHAGSPFESIGAGSLSRNGYIQQGPDGANRYYAPDVRVLMSPEFLEDHCLGLTRDPPRGVEEPWVGIRFRPRHSRTRDIEGTLWIDAEDLQPRRLDYRYTNLPRGLSSDHVGGRVEFARLPDGPWIVSRWWIRMPVPQLTRASGGAATRGRQLRYRVAALVEEGGEVARARAGDGRLLAMGRVGTVEGMVRTPAGAPVPDARVTLEGTVYRTATDSGGRFTLGGVPEGRYRVAWTTPLLDSLGLRGASAEATVPAGGSVHVEAVLPEPMAALAEQCGEPIDPEGTGVLRGRVLREDRAVSDDQAVVRISWGSDVDLKAVGSGGFSRPGLVTALVPVGEGGLWWACGVPHLQPLAVSAEAVPLRAQPSRRTVSTRLEEGGAAELTLHLPPVDGPSEVIPLAPLEVTVERARTMLTEVGLREEDLGRRFMGREDIEEALETGARDIEGVIRRLRLPGVVVDRMSRPGVAEVGQLCLHSYRYRSFTEYRPREFCARIYVDGIPSDAHGLDSLSPEDVKSIAFLREAEAGAMFGTGTPGGVLFVWTR